MDDHKKTINEKTINEKTIDDIKYVSNTTMNVEIDNNLHSFIVNNLNAITKKYTVDENNIAIIIHYMKAYDVSLFENNKYIVEESI